MKTESTWSIDKNSQKAIQKAYQKLRVKLKDDPHWLACFSTVNHDNHAIIEWLHTNAPGVPVHGGTSCFNVMTQDGQHGEDGFALGLMGIHDKKGMYRVGVCENSQNPAEAGAEAARQAMANSQEPLPAFLWLTCAPGFEEEIIKGMEWVTHKQIPIMGGSSSDNSIEGKWQQFANGKVYSDAVVVTAMYPSTEVYYFFWNGYFPTDKKGIITKADGRTVFEIDKRPASEVYNEWLEGQLHQTLEAQTKIFPETTLTPLGRKVLNNSFLESYYLAHPSIITPEGGLTLFADMQEGQELILMRSSKADLITRSGLVAQFALKKGKITPQQVAGSLLIYCAGCMITIEEDLEEVVNRINISLGGTPFLGIFTLGEQGCFRPSENYHGNLMTSIVVFTK